MPIQVHLDDCFVPRPLTPITRYRLLADMLHVRTTAIPWTPQMNLALPWAGDQRFQHDLADQVSAEEARLRSTVQAFFDKGPADPDAGWRRSGLASPSSCSIIAVVP